MANSEVVNDLSSQILLYSLLFLSLSPSSLYRSKDILGFYNIQLPEDPLVHCWDGALVTTVLKKLDPSLDFQLVFDKMDCSDFALSSQNALLFLLQVWKTAGLKHSILSLLEKPWHHQGMLSLL